MGHARVALLEISGEVVCEMKRAYGNIWGVFGAFNAVAHPYPEKKDIGAPRPASPALHGGVLDKYSQLTGRYRSFRPQTIPPRQLAVPLTKKKKRLQ